MTAIILRLACTFRLMSIQRLLLLHLPFPPPLLLLPILCPAGLQLKARRSCRPIDIRKCTAKNCVRVALSTAHPILIVLHLSLLMGLLKVRNAGLSGRAVWGVGLRLRDCWKCGLESRRGHGYLSLVSVVCCQVEVSHSSRGVLLIVVPRAWSRKFKNEEAMARVELQHQGGWGEEYVIMVAPQNDICPHGMVHPMNADAMVRKRITTPTDHERRSLYSYNP